MVELQVNRLRTTLLNQVFDSIDPRYGDVGKVELVASYIVKNMGVSSPDEGVRIARQLSFSPGGNRAMIDAAYENVSNAIAQEQGRNNGQ